VDGVIDSEEWLGALRTTMDDDTPVFWLHSGDTLYVAVLGDEVGSVNLALAEDDVVWILHSSAALGSARYDMLGDEWHLTDDFEWCCRSSVDQSEAEALLAAEGWLASIGYAGTPGHVEFRAEWPGGEVRVALSAVSRSGQATFWPVGLPNGAKEALYGVREEVESFEVDRWVSLDR
jgi:hypothetical protein